MAAAPSLWDATHGDAAEIVVDAGAVAGSARLGASHPSHGGWPLAGFLRLAGSVSLAGRFVFAVPAGNVPAFGERLTAAWASTGGRLDRYWVGLPASEADGEGERCVLLLAPDQVNAAREELAASALGAELVLASGQVVTSTAPSLLDRGLGRSATLELQPIRFAAGVPAAVVPDGVTLFQAHPSGGYARKLSASHSFRVLLAPEHRDRFASGFATIRNPLLDRAFPQPDVGLPVIVGFDGTVRPESS